MVYPDVCALAKEKKGRKIAIDKMITAKATGVVFTWFPSEDSLPNLS